MPGCTLTGKLSVVVKNNAKNAGVGLYNTSTYTRVYTILKRFKKKKKVFTYTYSETSLLS